MQEDDGRRGETLSVLVVDDDPAIRMVLEETMKGRGYSVDAVACGGDAWTAFTTKSYAMVVLDWGLPDLSGVDLCRRIREHVQGVDVFILMITGNSTPEDLQEALVAGADDYLTKPFSIKLLSVRLEIAEQQVRNMMNRRNAEDAMIRSQQLAAVGTLAAGVAHEFNNINTSTLGFLDLALDMYEIPEDARNLLERVRKSICRSTDLTRHLLSFAGQSKGRRRQADLNHVVNEMLAILSAEMASEGVEIVKELEPIPMVLVDAAQIGQVLMNLIINARHAMQGRKEKVLTLATSCSDKQCSLRVSDTGCGIASESIASVFLPFFSTKGEHSGADKVQSRIKGTGLGLAVSDTIIRQHNGRIEVESRVGEGTTFIVKLPVVHDDGAGQTKDSIDPLAVPESRRERILVLDDEEEVRDCLVRTLRLGGHEALSTDDGEEALKMHQEHAFDIILADLQMPKVHGIDFIERLHSLAAPRAEVIVITGMLSEEYTKRCEELGVKEILEKPFSPSLVLARVARK
ncbi:MAG: response regulator [Planctomycetota bacterium]|jgi:DNA-binding response OmpR family regulator